ncbi:MAG: hypothetical protein WAU74_15870 [Pseudolabrys sp.]
MIPSVGLGPATFDDELTADEVAAGKARIADAEVSVGFDPPRPAIHGKSRGGKLDLYLGGAGPP